GCGSGYGIALLAAANPHIHFVGVDFNVRQLEAGRRLAAVLPNLELVAATFQDLVDDPNLLGRCDMLVAHGVYSWVSTHDRTAIRRIAENALTAGGILYLHYTTHPGHSSFAGLQALLRSVGHTAKGGSPEAIAQGIGLARALSRSGAGY